MAGMRTIVFAHRAFRRYRVKTTVSDLTLAPPAPDAVAVWLTQWLVPANPVHIDRAHSCQNGGKNPSSPLLPPRTRT